MNKIIRGARYVTAVITLSILSFLSFAQDKGIDIDVDVNKKSEWYQQTWVWIVGGAVFVLLLVAILRGGGKKSD